MRTHYVDDGSDRFFQIKAIWCSSDFWRSVQAAFQMPLLFQLGQLGQTDRVHCATVLKIPKTVV